MGGGKCLRINCFGGFCIYCTGLKKLLKKLIFFRIFAGCAQKKNKMINNNPKLQQMAIHKQNNYTSPEVTVVEFKTENAFDSLGNWTAGRAALSNEGIPTAVKDQGTQDFGRATWSISQ